MQIQTVSYIQQRVKLKRCQKPGTIVLRRLSKLLLKFVWKCREPRGARKPARGGACWVPWGTPTLMTPGRDARLAQLLAVGIYSGDGTVGKQCVCTDRTGSMACFPDLPAQGHRGGSSPAGPRNTLRCPLQVGPGVLGPCGLTPAPVPGTHS